MAAGSGSGEGDAGVGSGVGVEGAEFDVVVGIDFGTSATGAFYAERPSGGSFSASEAKVYHVNLDPESTRGADAPKVPSSILLGSSTAFGWTALERFEELLEEAGAADGAAVGVQLWDRPKMHLSPDRRAEDVPVVFPRGMEDKEEAGKSLQWVVGQMLAWVRQRALSEIRKARPSLDAGRVLWVLTVPAIWDDLAKDVMRRAAVEGGLVESAASALLRLALEPECASVATFASLSEAARADVVREGKKVCVVDAGGGTIDITQSVVLHPSPLALEELACASGGGWGSGEIDALFRDFLSELFGKENWDNVSPASKLALHREWVRDIKEVFRADTRAGGTFKLELSLALEDADLTDEPGLRALCERYNRDKGLAGSDLALRTRERGKTSLRLPQQFVRLRFFDPIVDRIRAHVAEELAAARAEGRELDVILLAGGFAECPLLAEALKDLIGSDRVLVPESPARAVAVGAVLHGLAPTSVVVARRARRTVAYGRFDWFDADKDDPSKLFVDGEGRELARDRAIVVVRKNDLVKHGDPAATFEDYTLPLSASQKTLGVRFLKFEGDGEPPRYWTDPGFSPLGSVTVELKQDSAGDAEQPARLADSAVKIKVDFSGPEALAWVISEKTGDVKRVAIKYE